MSTAEETVTRFRSSFKQLEAQMSSVLVGQAEVIRLLFTGVISGGHMLVIGVPGKSPGEVAFHWPERKILFVGDCVVGNPSLLIAGVENRGSIAGPDVVALAIARAWVVKLEEELEDLPIADARAGSKITSTASACEP